MIGLLGKVMRRLSPRDDEFTSAPLRERFAAERRHIGLYSYGCFDLNRIGKDVTVGRYCSFADTVRIYTRNHGIDYLALTPYLYNSELGVVAQETIEHRPCIVEDDVWLGHNAIVLPGAGLIGRGAVIGAGAVVTRAVPRYAIVAGNPARLMRMRFTDDVIARIEATRWWEQDPAALRRRIEQERDTVFAPARAFADVRPGGMDRATTVVETRT